MGLTNLLNIEMYNDKLKQFNQDWEEMLLSLNKGVDEEMIDNVYGRQLEKIFDHVKRFIVVSPRHSSEERIEELPKTESQGE